MKQFITTHARAFTTIGLAAALDIVCGLSFANVEGLRTGRGLWWALVTATTVGYGDVVPRTALGYFLAVIVMLTVIPLFAASFSLFTSSLTAAHVQRHSEGLHRRLDEIHASMKSLTQAPRPRPRSSTKDQ